MSCLSDVTSGDLTGEEIDSQLLRATQLAQFSAQYLEASNSFLREKKKIFETGTILRVKLFPVESIYHYYVNLTAMDAFDNEEDTLNIQIAKLKSRKKAMLREVDSLNEMTAEYTDLLMSLDPELAEKHEQTAHAQKLKEAYDEEKVRNKERELYVLEQRERERARQIEFENSLMQEKQKENMLKRQLQLEQVRVEKLKLEDQLKVRSSSVQVVRPEVSDEVLAFNEKQQRLSSSLGKWESDRRISPVNSNEEDFPRSDSNTAGDLQITDVINLEEPEVYETSFIRKSQAALEFDQGKSSSTEFTGNMRRSLSFDVPNPTPPNESATTSTSIAQVSMESKKDQIYGEAINKPVRVIRTLEVRSVGSKQFSSTLPEKGKKIYFNKCFPSCNFFCIIN